MLIIGIAISLIGLLAALAVWLANGLLNLGEE